MAGRGLGAADEHARSTGRGRGGVFHVRLTEDQESCKLRFLTEHDDVYWVECHRALDANGRFAGWKACPLSYGQPCTMCAADDRPQTQIMAWVYEYYHDYTKPADGREAVRVGTVTRYRVQVNEVRLWRYSIMHRGAMKMRVDRYGTITDRDYEMIRAGEKGTTRPNYMLEPAGDPGKPSAAVSEAAKKLPDLEDVAFGRVTSMTGEAAEPAEPAKDYPTVNLPAESEADNEDGDLPDELPF